MSGIEVAGLLLGAFPLCISAMEHYEDTRRAAGTFVHIRRQHGKNYRRIRLCQTQFTLTIRQLLQPLLESATVDQKEHDELLAEPGGKHWKKPHVRSAISERLAEGGQDFVDALQDMFDTMSELGDQIYVNDPQFQALLKGKEHGKSSVTAQGDRDIDARAIAANLAFQTRRLKYAMTGARRDALLDDVDKQNQLLRDIVDSNDRLVSLSQTQNGRMRGPKPQKAILHLWAHAERIFRLLSDSWNCPCKAQHCADLWLKHRTTGLVDFQLHLRYCQALQTSSRPWTSKSVKISPSDAPRGVPIPAPVAAPQPTAPVTKTKSTRFSLPWRDKKQKIAKKVVISVPNNQPAAAASTPPCVPQPTPALKSLCEAIASLANSTADSITILADLDNDVFYSVDSAVGASPTSACVSLASLLEPTSNLKFSRMQRFRVALTLASSHLQLHSTPWLQEQWSAASVHLPVLTSDNSTTILGEPYLSQHFHITPSTTSTPSKPDRSFVSLGIVLLELCFGRRFDDCSFWSQPGFALLKDNPNMRLTMACQWLEDVEGDAGVDYASAVEWTLRQAPVAAKDNNWRLDFAENVVQPLARYCELLYGIQAVP